MRQGNRNRAFVWVAITLATCCYVLVDATATEHVAPYERFGVASQALFWGLPVLVAFALGYWIASANADTNALTETRVMAVLATAGVVSGHLLAYGVGIPTGIVPSLPISTAIVRTVVATVIVVLGAAAGNQLVRVEQGEAAVGWRLSAVVSGTNLLAGLAGFVHYQQASTGFLFAFTGSYWAVVAWLVRE